MCVCAVVSRLLFLFLSVVSVFFHCARTLFFLSGASGFVIVRAAWIVSVTFVFFGLGGF